MESKEIVCWDLSARPNLKQQERLLERLSKKLPEDAHPILQRGLGSPYQHTWWRLTLPQMNITQSMSRKGNCLEGGATEQVFGHLKDELYKGKENTFTSIKDLRRKLGTYIRYWNSKRRQEAIGGHTPEEYKQITLAS